MYHNQAGLEKNVKVHIRLPHALTPDTKWSKYSEKSDNVTSVLMDSELNPTIWHTYIKPLSKYQMAVLNNCNEKIVKGQKMEGQTHILTNYLCYL